MKPPTGRPALPPTFRFELSLANEQSLIALQRRRIREALRTTLEDERVVSCELSVAVVTDPRIHEINRQFLDHDEPTDVITFELSPPRAGERGAAAARGMPGPTGSRQAD